jgi:hypothetical protein
VPAESWELSPVKFLRIGQVFVHAAARTTL